MTNRRAAAACTGGWASMSAGKRLSSAICRIGPGCSAGEVEVSSGTVADHHQPGDLPMSRLGFGAFLAPHHPIGEHPMLQFRRDLDLVEHLDKLGYEEFWCGEHHSSGWEMIGSPEMFLAARVTAKSDWFTLQDAALQLLPLQEEMPFAVASQISPSGMTLAGKHGIGIISIGSMSSEGLNALPTQWGFADAAAAKHGKTVDRKNWRVLLSWHIAETREKARAEAREGLLRHHNQYVVGTLQRPGAKPFSDPDEAVEKTAFSDEAAATIGTPDDLVKRIKSVLEISGGFGTVVGFVHDWANPENTMRSWDMVARYVVPEINGYLAGLRQSQDFVATNRGVFDRAKEAIMAKINENEAAVAALSVTRGSRLGDVASASNMPDLDKARGHAGAR